MSTVFSRLSDLLRDVKELVGAGPLLLLTALLIEGLTFAARQWLSLPLHLMVRSQVLLSVPVLILCLSGVIWFHRTLNLTDIFLFHRTRELITDGPFACVRHPLYATLIITIPPLVIIWGSDLLFAVPWVLIVIISHRIVRYEEKALLEIFGEDYARYRKQVPALLPLRGSGGQGHRNSSQV